MLAADCGGCIAFSQTQHVANEVFIADKVFVGKPRVRTF